MRAQRCMLCSVLPLEYRPAHLFDWHGEGLDGGSDVCCLHYHAATQHPAAHASPFVCAVSVRVGDRIVLYEGERESEKVKRLYGRGLVPQTVRWVMNVRGEGGVRDQSGRRGVRRSQVGEKQ